MGDRRPGAADGAERALGSMDAESRTWLRDLRSEGAGRDLAVGRLHELLLKVARSEAARRRPNLPDTVVGELDDLCVQAASDAVMAVTRKLDAFRGASRFTTWACKFAILEISTRVRRRSWRGRAVETDETVWDRLADAAPSALQGLEHGELREALRRAVREDLTDRQRAIFHAAVIDEVPIDVLAERLRSSRGAVYKSLHDARRKLRQALIQAGHLEGLAS